MHVHVLFLFDLDLVLLGNINFLEKKVYSNIKFTTFI